MNLNLRTAIANERLDALSKTEADLKTQFLELKKLRERLLGAEFAHLKKTTRARRPSPSTITAAA
jgi:hypothetical protein